MASILDGLGLEGSVLDGLVEWPASTTIKSGSPSSWVDPQTIADMDLEPAALAEVEGDNVKAPKNYVQIETTRQTQSAVQADALIAEPHPLLEHQVAVRAPEGLGDLNQFSGGGTSPRALSRSISARIRPALYSGWPKCIN